MVKFVKSEFILPDFLVERAEQTAKETGIALNHLVAFSLRQIIRDNGIPINWFDDGKNVEAVLTEFANSGLSKEKIDSLALLIFSI